MDENKRSTLPAPRGSGITLGQLGRYTCNLSPTKVLDLCFTVIPKPPESIIHKISLLSWLPPREFKSYQQKLEEQFENHMKSEKEKERWKCHKLYQNHTKPQLEVLCRKSGIPVISSIAKHQLVALLAEKNGESVPPLVTTAEYSGNLSSIPATTTGISRLTIAYLKSVLSFHHLPTIGSKDQLVLRTYMLRVNRMADAVAREENQLRDLIDIVRMP